MKIAMLTPVYPPYKGGIGSVAHQYATDLRQLREQVTVMTPRYSSRPVAVGEVMALRPWLAVGNAAILPQVLWKLAGHDVAHLHYTFYGTDIFVWLWSVLTHKPYVLTYHMRPQTKDWRNWIFRCHRYVFEPALIRRAAAVLVSSQDYAQAFDLHHQRLIEMPFGVDQTRFMPGQNFAQRQALAIPDQATVFLFVGKLDAAHVFKGVDVLLHAAVELVGEWRLMIVGDGDRRITYEHLASQLGIRDKVCFAGEVSDADLPAYYQAADVHVLPSTTTSEAFGLVTLEAAASGLPSIVADLPGVRTLVVPGQTGAVVRPGQPHDLAEAMQAYLTEPERRAQQGAQARLRVERVYTHDALARRLAEVYKSVVTTAV